MRIAAARTKRTLTAGLIGLALACGACSGRPSQGVLIPIAESAEGTSRVPLLAVTTRQRSTTDPGEMFNGDRADDTSYAAITVSIPPDSARKVGAVQWPGSLPGDPSRNFVTVSANHIDKPTFTTALSAMAKQTGRSRVVIFVHGFNNRFDDAVYRFAQILHDAKVEGIPVLFTWPSRGTLGFRSYAYDHESASYSRDALEQLLEVVATTPGINDVSIAAHSMGNWVTLEALRGRSIRAGRIGDKFKNVFLVAPDVDVDVFRTQIRRIGNPRPRFALFVSQDDLALNLSQSIFGGKQRLGEINPNEEPYHSMLEQERIAVFDLTKLKGSGHTKAFDDVTEVMAMVRERFGDEQAATTARTRQVSAKKR